MKPNKPQSSMDVGTIRSTGTFSGSGMFSEVYILPDNRAAKVCNSANADAWLLWALFCMTHGAGMPHVPIIHGIRINREENQFVGVLDAMTLEFGSFADAARHCGEDAVFAALEKMRATDSAFRTFLVEMSINLNVASDWDIAHNVMADDNGNLFLTDPAVYQGWPNLQENKTGREILDEIIAHVRAHPDMYPKVEIVGEAS